MRDLHTMLAVAQGSCKVHATTGVKLKFRTNSTTYCAYIQLLPDVKIYPKFDFEASQTT